MADDDFRDPAQVGPGSLLIASTLLTGPTFGRTVIYIVEHDHTGTLGLVLNQMSQTAVHNILPQWAQLAASPRAVFIGGPVQAETAVCLGVAKTGINPSEQPGLRPVRGPVCMVDLDADPEELEQALTGIRIFAGFAGWEPGQLDDELAEDSWIVAPSLPSDLLAPATVDLWHDVLRRQPWPLPLLATYPMEALTN